MEDPMEMTTFEFAVFCYVAGAVLTAVSLISTVFENHEDIEAGVGQKVSLWMWILVVGLMSLLWPVSLAFGLLHDCTIFKQFTFHTSLLYSNKQKESKMKKIFVVTGGVVDLETDEYNIFEPEVYETKEDALKAVREMLEDEKQYCIEKRMEYLEDSTRYVKDDEADPENPDNQDFFIFGKFGRNTEIKMRAVDI